MSSTTVEQATQGLTKKERIRNLLKKGVETDTIVSLVNCSRAYVLNQIREVENGKDNKEEAFYIGHVPEYTIAETLHYIALRKAGFSRTESCEKSGLAYQEAVYLEKSPAHIARRHPDTKDAMEELLEIIDDESLYRKVYKVHSNHQQWFQVN